MDKEKIKELARDERFISGIYNYCDRWCERCPQTSRCLNYAIGEEEFAAAETRDIRNEAFWKKLSETFQVTFEMLKEMAEQHGIDLDALDADEFEEQNRLLKEAAENHKICRATRAYIDMAEKWFNGARAFSVEGDAERNDRSVDETRKDVDTDSLEEPLEVIRWYQHQIYVKLVRAVRGLMEDGLEPAGEMDRYAKDSDGSAKVALIGIDRTIAAWGIVRNRFPYHDPAVQALLIHLGQLRREVEKAFPEARGFIRPGFDRVDLNG